MKRIAILVAGLLVLVPLSWISHVWLIREVANCAQ